MGLCMSYEDPQAPTSIDKVLPKEVASRQASRSEADQYKFDKTGDSLPTLTVRSLHPDDFSPLSSPATVNESFGATPTAQRTERTAGLELNGDASQ